MQLLPSLLMVSALAICSQANGWLDARDVLEDALSNLTSIIGKLPPLPTNTATPKDATEIKKEVDELNVEVSDLVANLTFLPTANTGTPLLENTTFDQEHARTALLNVLSVVLFNHTLPNDEISTDHDDSTTSFSNTTPTSHTSPPLDTVTDAPTSQSPAKTDTPFVEDTASYEEHARTALINVLSVVLFNHTLPNAAHTNPELATVTTAPRPRLPTITETPFTTSWTTILIAFFVFLFLIIISYFVCFSNFPAFHRLRKVPKSDMYVEM